MKNILFLLQFVLSVQILFSQNLFYCYPDSEKDLIKGDKIILSIPVHFDGMFEKSKSLDRLIKFINDNKNLSIRIEINIFYGSNERSKDYSESLCRNLKVLLKERCKGAKYSVISNGSNNPLFTDKSDPENYMKLNTRMEILIE